MKKSKYQLLPDLLSEEYDLLKASIAHHGVEVPIIVDQEASVIDGVHRQRACDELGINCPREVRHFETEAEKFELALRLNCRRRQLNRKQKRGLIAAYLKCDPQIADNYLAEIIGGISKNTVTDVRTELEATCLIDKFETLRGKDGKNRPTKYKRIIANTPKEMETALEAIQYLPDNCDGKILDVISARRRAQQNRKREEREKNPLPTLTSDDIKLHHCRFQDLEAAAGIKPASVNLVFPDIPYDGGFLPQISELAALASRILVDGGLFLMYCGQFYLPEVFRRLDAHLTYRWTCTSIWDGDGNLIHPLNVTSKWKPILLYSKGEWVKRGQWPDVSRINSKEKDWHPLQQPLCEVEQWVRYFSDHGDLVVDPVGGGFTTAVACYRLGRRCISCDCVEESVNKGRQRLAEEMTKLSDPPIVADTSDQETQDSSPAQHFSRSEVEQWKGRKLTVLEESIRRFFADKPWCVGGPIPLRLLYGADSMSLVRDTDQHGGLRRAGDLLGQDALAQLKEQMKTRKIREEHHGGLALLYLRLCKGLEVQSRLAP